MTNITLSDVRDLIVRASKDNRKIKALKIGEEEFENFETIFWHLGFKLNKFDGIPIIVSNKIYGFCIEVK